MQKFPSELDCNGRRLDFRRPIVMGALNVTPDSYYDGGWYQDKDVALRHALQMIEEGAAIIDVGGESTRPGAKPLSPSEERDRVIPILECLMRETDVPISVDTSCYDIMSEALSLGVNLINDVRSFSRPKTLELVAAANIPISIMHMKGEPGVMQSNPHYSNPVKEIFDFLSDKIKQCVSKGVKRSNIIVDPGIGFGKTLAHNMAVIHHLKKFTELGSPLLIGISRKTCIGQITEREVNDRLPGSLAATGIAIMNGANIIRAHDVAATVDAIRVAEAISEGG